MEIGNWKLENGNWKLEPVIGRNHDAPAHGGNAIDLLATWRRFLHSRRVIVRLGRRYLPLLRTNRETPLVVFFTHHHGRFGFRHSNGTTWKRKFGIRRERGIGRTAQRTQQKRSFTHITNYITWRERRAWPQRPQIGKARGFPQHVRP